MVNSLLFNIKAFNAPGATDQLNWLEDELKNKPGKVIISMHIYPGENYVNSEETFWHQNYTD